MRSSTQHDSSRCTRVGVTRALRFAKLVERRVARRGAAQRSAARAQHKHSTTQYGTLAADITANMERARKLSSPLLSRPGPGVRDPTNTLADNANRIRRASKRFLFLSLFRYSFPAGLNSRKLPER
jgi:hypothetical protein